MSVFKKGPSAAKLSFAALIAFVFVVVAVWGTITYNELVERRECAFNAQAQIDSMLKRRADLIPQLVRIVKGYTAHEEKVFEEVDRRRAEAAKSIGKGTIGAMKADSLLAAAESRLFALAENYPQLRASEQFLTLQAQVEGTENRINVARLVYNDAVRAYNAYFKKLQVQPIATMGGFEKMRYYKVKVDAGAPKEFFGEEK